MRTRLSNQYKAGDHLSTCDRCGFTRYGSQMKKEWTGLIVCPECYDPRHPQDFVRPKADSQSARDPRPQPNDVFVAHVCTLAEQSSYPGYAVAGCSIAGLTPTLS